jgi:hypothetical protein
VSPTLFAPAIDQPDHAFPALADMMDTDVRIEDEQLRRIEELFTGTVSFRREAGKAIGGRGALLQFHLIR